MFRIGKRISSGVSHLIRPQTSQGNFKALYGFKHKEAQLPIQLVEAKDVFEGSSRHKLMGFVVSFKGVPVRAQAAVVHFPEPRFGFLFVRDRKAPFFQPVYLLL
ncbi:hypothetical protein TO73_2869 (plasmid) [Thermus aquaticus Y51MC23]|uniref:Uncharacterized protein n=1 Tax=Thermus aquaticus (strain ATCC BAA-2747 / Y51MC23) TaxID=498848 RepID=A0ABM5VRN3_THEA5|nr:hypothetical protein TO73_2869 [Thermus aquaticus Y51MC23]